ncbi:MAG: hypothetical protein P4L10_10875 [Acidobacteriaceae bacterium]|nr:hypothetical protein [Acidobacteriaceae bacterium]
MTQYAYFDSTISAPSPVVSWPDTEFLPLVNMPPAADLLALTPAQWDARMTGLWAVSNGALVAYTPPVIAPTLAEAQATQTAQIIAAAQAALAAIVAAYPDLEVATWPQQYAEAQAYTASSTAPTPMLSAIATASGSTVAVMAQGVMAKASSYQAASGAVIGKRMALTGQIAAATTVAAVQAVAW